MMAVGISGVDLSVTPKMFSVSMVQTSVAPGGSTLTPVTLSPCNISDWASLGPSFAGQYTG
jgi:hypothetical protein